MFEQEAPGHPSVPAEVAERDTAVGSLYLKKAVVRDPPPSQLRVRIEANLGPAV
jgi:hypothetical protein